VDVLKDWSPLRDGLDVYKIPHVHGTTHMTCTCHHIYTSPLVIDIHSPRYTQRHLYNMYTSPHAHNTTLTIMHTSPYVHSTTCTTFMQHHLYIELHYQHVHSIICTHHCISNMHRAPYSHTPHILHEDNTICIQHPICNIHTILFVPSCI